MLHKPYKHHTLKRVICVRLVILEKEATCSAQTNINGTSMGSHYTPGISTHLLGEDPNYSQDR